MELKTPAFIYNEDELKRKANLIRNIVHEAGGHFYYSLKAQCFAEILKILASYVDGFSCASSYEAQMAQLIAPDLPRFGHHVALGQEGLQSLPQYYGHYSFNSLHQLRRFLDLEILQKKLPYRGLRVNPGFSWAADLRYDPGRPGSKLGVSLEELSSLIIKRDPILKEINGLHVHCFSELTDFSHFNVMLEKLEKTLAPIFSQLSWINLGGGLLIEDAKNQSQFTEALKRLQDQYGILPIVEPGYDVVEGCACLVTKVLDIVQNNGVKVAILDTTVAHMPEVFEYGDSPELKEHDPLGEFSYQLAGLSCLAGDIFGNYNFKFPLERGQNLTFLFTGAYTTVKAQMFNGINLPDVWSFNNQQGLTLKRSYHFSDFYCRHSTWDGLREFSETFTGSPS